MSLSFVGSKLVFGAGGAVASEVGNLVLGIDKHPLILRQIESVRQAQVAMNRSLERLSLTVDWNAKVERAADAEEVLVGLLDAVTDAWQLPDPAYAAERDRVGAEILGANGVLEQLDVIHAALMGTFVENRGQTHGTRDSLLGLVEALAYQELTDPASRTGVDGYVQLIDGYLDAVVELQVAALGAYLLFATADDARDELRQLDERLTAQAALRTRLELPLARILAQHRGEPYLLKHPDRDLVLRGYPALETTTVVDAEPITRRYTAPVRLAKPAKDDRGDQWSFTRSPSFADDGTYCLVKVDVASMPDNDPFLRRGVDRDGDDVEFLCNGSRETAARFKLIPRRPPSARPDALLVSLVDRGGAWLSERDNAWGRGRRGSFTWELLPQTTRRAAGTTWHDA